MRDTARTVRRQVTHRSRPSAVTTATVRAAVMISAITVINTGYLYIVPRFPVSGSAPPAPAVAVVGGVPQHFGDTLRTTLIVGQYPQLVTAAGGVENDHRHDLAHVAGVNLGETGHDGV
jgi:hypothetical protein